MGNISHNADEKRDRVVAAATNVFLRYGFYRTTMADIAKAAGMSRPALYLLFPGKEDIFAAVVLGITRRLVLESRNELPNYPTLKAKLLFVCEKWAGDGFELIEKHPDAADMFDLRFPPVRAMYEESQVLFAEVLADAVEVSDSEGTKEDLARLLAYSFRGFKEAAADGADMRRMIRLQVLLLARALAKSAQARPRRTKSS